MDNSLINEKDYIVKLARDYYSKKISKEKFIPGHSYIPPTGKVLDEDDCENLIQSSLDMWLTSGRFASKFERSLAKKFGKNISKLTVSGSAANLLAFSTLTSWKLGDKKIKPGDEVITVAAGFPTTVAPILQNGCIPVFVDIDITTHNVNVDLLKKAITKKTKAIMIAHSLGNPFDVVSTKKLCEENNLFLIEDCCDAFGSTVTTEDGKIKNVGNFADLATLSFYPAHHITMGEGGAVLMNSPMLGRICESFRDWGRDCFCKPGESNTCGKRFDWDLGDLPFGYDHKYTYSHIGYNLKVSDMQAAVGLSQLQKLDKFIEKRRYNFQGLTKRIKSLKLDKYFILPQATKGSNPSWFGFLLTIKDSSKLDRNLLTRKLEEKKVGTRLLFGGNLTKQPAFKDQKFRIFGSLINTDKVMNDSFWIGLWPGLDDEHLDYMVNSLENVVNEIK